MSDAKQWECGELYTDGLSGSQVDVYENAAPAGDRIVAAVFGGNERLCEARSAQIAAAPDLLAALKAILNVDNPPAGEPGHIDLLVAVDMGNAAIAKAEPKTGAEQC